MTQHPPVARTDAHPAQDEPGRQGRRIALRLVGLAVVVGAAVLLGVFLLFAQLADETQPDPAPTPVAEKQLSEAAFAAVPLGTDKEQALQSLLPVEPIDNRVMDRFEARAPETVASECVYYERANGVAGEFYRFCFVEDVLVDKTVVFPDDPGIG